MMKKFSSQYIHH